VKRTLIPSPAFPAVAILESDGTLVAAQRQGEFHNASALLSVAEIVSFFHRWAPVGKL
jgi:hypothetical protein